MTQEQVTHHARERTEESPSDLPAKDVDTDKLKADLDAVLDEIDEALEENAEEFVRNYVQKGGE